MGRRSWSKPIRSLKARCRILRCECSRHARIPIGVLLILSSAFWFLPVFGIEYLPAGLLLAQDVPFLRKPVGYTVIWLVRRWLVLRQWRKAPKEPIEGRSGADPGPGLLH
jgi:hypothetical protein